MHHAGHVDLAGEVLAGGGGEVGGGAGHSGDSALHVRGAAAVDLVVHDLGGEGIVLPLAGVLYGHGVDMPVKQDLRAGTVALDAADDVAVLVDRDAVKAHLLHVLLEHLDHALLLAGVAALLDQFLAKPHHGLFLFLVQHKSYLPVYLNAPASA